MKRNGFKKVVAILGITALSSAFLAGCGSSAEPAEAEIPAAEVAAADAPAGDAAQESVAAETVEAQVVEVALESGNAPYTYEDENGNPAGYEYEVLKLVDDLLPEYTFHYQVVDYETAAAGVSNGRYDFESGCKFRTPAREEAYLVSVPYNYFFMNLVVKSDSGITGLEDLAGGKSIASIVGTDGRAVALNDWIKAHPDVDLEFEELAASGSMADEIIGVEEGTFDAAYLSAEQANAIFEELKFDDLTITDRVDGRDTVFLINKEKTDIQAALNRALEELTNQGTLGQLTVDFFGEDNFEVARNIGLKKD